MSLRTVLGGVGAVVGFIYGGPQGARWGFMIGSTIGSLVDPGTVKGPSLGELAQQTSQEGGPRAIVFVRSPPMAGNVIDQSDPRIVKKKSGGKGGPKQVTETVFRTYAIGVCEGPIAGFRRIWRNNVLVYDASETPAISDDDNASFLTKARFFLGDYEQDASPDLEAIHGAGTTPAYRGTAYMVMADEDLTDLRGAIPQWTFEVASGCVYEKVVFTDTGQFMNTGIWNRPEGVERINLILVGPGGPGGVVPGSSACGAGGGGGGGQVLYELDIDVSEHDTWMIKVDRNDIYGDGAIYDEGGIPTLSTKFGWWDGMAFHQVREAIPGGNGRQYSDGHNGNGASGGGGGRALFVDSIGTGYPRCGIDGFSIFGITTNTPYPPGSPTIADHHPGGNSSWNHNECVQFLEFGSCAGGGGGAGGPGQDGTPSQGGAGGIGRYLGHLIGNEYGKNGYFGGGGGGGSSANNWVSALPSPLPMPEGGIAPGGQGTHGGGNGDGFNGATATPGFPTSGGGGGGGPAGFTDFPGHSGGSGLGAILFCPGGQSALSLKNVVLTICARAGLPETLVDVSLLPDVNIEGLAATNQYTAAEILRSLGQAYLFDPSPRDGKVWFIPRGGNAVAVISADEYVDEDTDVEDSRRDDSISVPRVLHLNYWDVAGGLATSKQSSERSGDRRSVGETSIQTSVLMTADQAAQNVVVNHKVLAENQKGSENLTLSDKWIGLRIADPIIAEIASVNHRFLIQKMSVMDGYQKYEVTYDRQSAYTSNVEGIPAAPQTPPPTSNVGPTLVVPLDIQLLRDNDDTAGLSYYVAVGGISPAWRGALVELSYDGGENYVDSQEASASSVIGTLTSDLQDHPAEYPDTVNSFTVNIKTADPELEDTDLAGMQNRKNLAAVGDPVGGWELINFATPEEGTSNEWNISYMLRGRKDSGTRVHATGETFVMLDRNILGFVVSSVTDIGRTLTIRATSLGAPVETGTVVSMVYRGQSQIERHVGYLAGRIVGDNLILEWQGVARLGGGASVAHGEHFTGYRVTLDDGVNPPIVIDTASQTITQDISSLEDDFTAEVVQLNDLTGEGPPSFWPEEPVGTAPPPDTSAPSYLFELGGDTPFGIGGLLVNRLHFDDKILAPFYIDVRYIVTTGLDYSLHYYPNGAEDIDDRFAVYALADQVWGLTRHPTNTDRIYWSDGNTLTLADVFNNDDGGPPVVTTLSPGRSDVMFNGGDLFVLHLVDAFNNYVEIIDEDTLSLITQLNLDTALPFRFIRGTDASAPNSVWIATYDWNLIRIDRTTGVIDKTIAAAYFPMGGLIVGDFIYAYCKGGTGPGDYAFGVYKYQISTETEVDSFPNIDDMEQYIGQESNAVVVDDPYLSVGWSTGHKVFDTGTETYIDAP